MPSWDIGWGMDPYYGNFVYFLPPAAATAIMAMAAPDFLLLSIFFFGGWLVDVVDKSGPTRTHIFLIRGRRRRGRNCWPCKPRAFFLSPFQRRYLIWRSGKWPSLYRRQADAESLPILYSPFLLNVAILSQISSGNSLDTFHTHTQYTSSSLRESGITTNSFCSSCIDDDGARPTGRCVVVCRFLCQTAFGRAGSRSESWGRLYVAPGEGLRANVMGSLRENCSPVRHLKTSSSSAM